MGRASMGRLTVGLAAVVVLTACSPTGGSPEGGAGTSSSGSATAAAPSRADGGSYLALGDSVPFGFRGGATADFSDADNFVGYPDMVAEELDLELINASCPGETTASFLDTTAQSNGCQNSLQSRFGYRTAYPLHVPYDAANQSQLDLAVSALTEAGDDVELVTLQIGANDGFICQRTTAGRCTSPTEIQGLVDTVQANLDRILQAVRERYDGQIVVVTYYALDYSDPTGAATQVLDDGIAEVARQNGADVADGYEAFRREATAAGGSSVDAGLVLPEDVHPTEEGQRLLADAVMSVVG